MSAPSPTAVRVATTYAPHARQLALHNATEGFVWFAAGYGCGKSTAAVFEALSLATVTHPGHAGIVAGPTFPLLMQSWFEEWKRNVPRSRWSLKRDPLSGPFLSIPTPEGESRVWLRSTVDATSLEGINAAWMVFDEATRERSPEPFRVLLARVRRGYPGRQRRVLVIGPPQTRSHWTAQEFGTGPDATRAGDALSWTDGKRRVVRARTRDNPFLPDGFERDLRNRPGASKAWAKQWLDAEFGAAEGQVFEAFSRDVHVVPAASLVDRTWADVVGAVDWGWTHPGVLLIVARDGRGDLYVIHEEVHRGKVVAETPDGWVPLLRSTCRARRARRLFCDPSQPGHMETVGRGMRDKGGRIATVYPAENDVAEGLRRVTALLEWSVDRARTGVVTLGRSALYVSDACPHTIGEFESYSRRKARDGSFSEDPEKISDDAMDALRYAVMEFANAA